MKRPFYQAAPRTLECPHTILYVINRVSRSLTLMYPEVPYPLPHSPPQALAFPTLFPSSSD